MARFIVIFLSALWLACCFVNDELRRGDAVIERYSIGWREKMKQMEEAAKAEAKAEAEATQKKATASGPAVPEKLASWWHETVDEPPVQADPDDKLVSCEIHGKIQFLRKSDCQLRRGRAAALKTDTATDASATSKSKPGA